jgi:hypothetical protein
MARRAARRRLFIGLAAALVVNAALLALLAPAGREVAWRTPADADVAMRLELTREPLRRAESKLATSADGRRAAQAKQSPQPSTEISTAASAQARVPPPPSDQGSKAGGVQEGGDADLQARTALALRKLGACSRVNSGTGDAQDKALCTPNFAAADGATIDTIPIGKRADYDAAHAKAGYLVPADAANPNFVTSQFKRGGTVWTIHAGCGLVHGKWQCGLH